MGGEGLPDTKEKWACLWFQRGGGKFVVVVFSFFKQKPLLCCDFCFSQMKYMSSAFALEEECLSLQQV